MLQTIHDDAQSVYLKDFRRLERERQSDPGWLHDLRRAAFDRFCKSGFPTTHEEDWRFTNVRAIARRAFTRDTMDVESVTREHLERVPFGDLGVARAVFVNGRYRPALSSLETLAAGATVRSMKQLIEAEPDFAKPYLGRRVGIDTDAFAALNTAFIEDGAVVSVAAGAVIEEPIHLVFVTTPSADGRVFHPRNLVVVGRNARAQIVETYISLGEGVCLMNPVTEVFAKENANLDFVKVQQENTRTFHIGHVGLHQSRDSVVSSHVFAIGAALSRTDLRCRLDGAGAETTLNGLTLARGDQLIDNYTKLEHAKPNCRSRELYKGILDDNAHVVFHGRVLVEQDAQETDSEQSNRNLLLSDDARINTKPQLEIYADQVKCTHGATVGRIDEDALFYLRSRGIEESAARGLLIYGFAREMMEAITFDALHAQLLDMLAQWLPEGKPVKEVAE